jgi:hypothetical protein
MSNTNTSGSANSTTPTAGSPKLAALGLRAALEAMLSGVQQVIPDGSDVLVAGVKLKKADVVAKLQAFTSQYDAITTQAATLLAERQGLKQALPDARTLLQELKDAVIAAFGRGSPEIQKFGLRVRATRKQPTVQQKALAAEKARRTRALRGTKGSRQKAAIRYVGQPTLVLGPNPQANAAGPSAAAPSSGSGSKPPVVNGGV